VRRIPCLNPCDLLTLFPGRSRRKKCDEKAPVCGLCSLSNRDCRWPTSEDRLDRRYASHRQSRHSIKSTPSPSTDDDEDVTETDILLIQWPRAAAGKISLPSESIARCDMSLNLEIAISQHFVDKYHDFLLLPNCHPCFFDGWITEIQHLMAEDKSLRYSVLANGASHLYLTDENTNMQQLALTYYSKAIRELSKLLSTERQLENHNGLLVSVILLYLHGCTGRGTYTDVPQHVSAAARILNLRLISSRLGITLPFDRLAVESVLFQIFLVATGLWSEDIPFDSESAQFWLKAETLLDQGMMFPGKSNSLNSPVLGVPVSLFRLALKLKQRFQGARGSGLDVTTLHNLRSEVEDWEVLVLCDKELDRLSPDETATHTQRFYRDASYLYILIISLLLEQIESCLGRPATTSTLDLPEMVPSSSWQITKALSILHDNRNDDEWKLSFIGNWPVYTLGFFMNTEEHVQIVKSEVNDRWRLTRNSQWARFSGDLQTVWRRRGFDVGDAPRY
jgi:hypothetical protein